ncbi:hypothetical protein FJW04_12395 [Mesorhizobium sp. B2-7-3]|nr:hypothetical protein FJW04_12395 [Mesorhizobium sp. B2-7-3]TPK87746.1 hypothetical protein FJ936_01280 [Mesorhizobium sp. B2-4-13]
MRKDLGSSTVILGCHRRFANSRKAGSAPHPPAGTFSPYSDGEKGSAPALVRPSPRLYTGRG